MIETVEETFRDENQVLYDFLRIVFGPRATIFVTTDVEPDATFNRFNESLAAVPTILLPDTSDYVGLGTFGDSTIVKVRSHPVTAFFFAQY